MLLRTYWLTLHEKESCLLDAHGLPSTPTLIIFSIDCSSFCSSSLNIYSTIGIGNMGEPDQARLEHWEEMLKAWGVADEKFTSRDIFGEKVSKVILQHAAVAACHELPYALSIMANLMACTNGAQVSAFANGPSPLMLAVLNVNYPQTRKSAAAAANSKIGKCINKRSLKRAKKWASQANGERPASATDVGNVVSELQPPVNTIKVRSCMLSKFTEAAFFQHFAPDWEQVEVKDQGGVGTSRGRVHRSTLRHTSY